jgi:hypothetical protein
MTDMTDIIKDPLAAYKEWEMVCEETNGVTMRLKVEGGYLYYVGITIAKAIGMTFVPDVDLQRYQAHLRDAYKKGYEDGQSDGKQGIKNNV